MSSIVLDASVILALLNHEPGADKIPRHLLLEATSSTVNLAEVQTKLVRDGGLAREAWEDALSVAPHATPFDTEHAELAGSLVSQTRVLGLSLGDRACLALGMLMKAPVYTTDKTWKQLNLGIPIHIVR